MAKKEPLEIIVVPHEEGRYHACLASDPRVWGKGATTKEAVGDLVASNPELFAKITELF